jgi:beta-barrel assembly-enhancing protease
MQHFMNIGAKPTAAVLALAGGLTLGATGCAPAITTQQEVEIGREYSAQIAREMPLVNDAASVRYINQLGNQIAQLADPRGIAYTFYIVNAPEVNAFAVPGGHIYINRGLIERSSTMSELAGVLAHEVAHVAHRHGIDQWRRAQTANTALSVLYGVLLGRPPSGVEQVGIQAGGSAVFAGYSRDAEREADATAIEYLIRAGIHPRGMVTMFETLMAERQRNPGAVEQWFSTHPTTEERITNTRNRINAIPQSRLQNLTTNTQSYNDFRARVNRLPAPPRR